MIDDSQFLAKKSQALSPVGYSSTGGHGVVGLSGKLVKSSVQESNNLDGKAAKAIRIASREGRPTKAMPQTAQVSLLGNR